MSQRELAAFTGVSLGTITRAEADISEPRLTAFATIMVALGYDLLLVDWRGRVLEVDEEHERFRDTSNRRFPAHLRAGRTPTLDEGGWWGYYRIAWWSKDAPPYTYWKRDQVRQHRIGTNFGHNEVWDDAT